MFEIMLYVGRVTSLQSCVAKKSCHGQTLINECLFLTTLPKHCPFYMMATNLNLRFPVTLILKKDYINKKYETVFKYTVGVMDVTALM